jgi:uncharacterized cupin superfamily protein
MKTALMLMAACAFAAAAQPDLALAADHPAKIAASAMPLAIFGSKQAVKVEKDGSVLDVPLRKSADGKFMSGVYSVKKQHVEDYRKDGYPDDEFMLFVKGGITLISSDGHVTQVKAGDAVALNKGWKGLWKSNGYTKYYVIYSQEGVE